MFDIVRQLHAARRRQKLEWVWMPDEPAPAPVICSGASATSCPDYATASEGGFLTLYLRQRSHY
jgi:hypothetical protein